MRAAGLAPPGHAQWPGGASENSPVAPSQGTAPGVAYPCSLSVYETGDKARMDLGTGFPSQALLLLLATTLARGSLGSVLLVAGAAKLLSVQQFMRAVEHYRVLPRRLARGYGAVLPWIEGTVGILLVLGWQSRPAAAVAVVLLCSFVVAVGVNLARGRDVACYCFRAAHQERISTATLVRQIVLLALAAWIIGVGPGAFALENWFADAGRAVSRSDQMLMLLIGTLVTAVVGILLAQALVLRDQLGSLSARHRRAVPTPSQEHSGAFTGHQYSDAHGAMAGAGAHPVAAAARE